MKKDLQIHLVCCFIFKYVYLNTFNQNLICSSHCVSSFPVPGIYSSISLCGKILSGGFPLTFVFLEQTTLILLYYFLSYLNA